MRINELDAFRGIAALSVVFYHYTTRFNELFNSSSYFNFEYGWLGVPFFFILSGFVITLTINRCKSPFDFLYRRFVRLYPTFWICLITTLITIYGFKLMSIHEIFKLSSLDILMNFTMFHQFFNFEHVDGSYWSLLPELLFYLLMAFLFFIKKVEKIILYNSALIILCILHYYFPLPIIGKLLDLHYVLLFMSGINYYAIYKKENKFHNHILILLNLLIGVLLYKVQHPTHSILFLLISFLLIKIIFYLFVYNKLVFFEKFKILIFLGTISYPLYLVHQNFGYAIMLSLEKLNLNREIGIWIALILSIIVASIITFYIEPPLKKFLKKMKKN